MAEDVGLVPDTFYMKSPSAMAAGDIENFLLLLPDAPVTTFTGPSAAIARELIAFASEPVSAKALSEHQSQLGPEAEEILRLLLKNRLLLRMRPEERDRLLAPRAPATTICNHLVVGITGTIGAATTFGYVDHLCHHLCSNLDGPVSLISLLIQQRHSNSRVPTRPSPGLP